MPLPNACSHVSTSFGNFILSAILKQEKGFRVSLKEYARKRSFAQTPDPKPDKPAAARAGGYFFCVQRHHATRLHYDFRLEVDGALVSWAVPKGPTLSPAEKRLA